MKLLKRFFAPTPTLSGTNIRIITYNSAKITNITVNGVAISAVTFPVVAGDGASGVSNQMGTYSVVISYSGASSDYIEITDTDGNSHDSAKVKL